eukprot:1217050-Prymnesium_polylepis.1
MCTETCNKSPEPTECETGTSGSARDHWWAGPPPEQDREIDAQRWDVYGNENNILDAIGTIGTSGSNGNDYTYLNNRYYHGAWGKGSGFGSFVAGGSSRFGALDHRTHTDYAPGVAERQGNPSLGAGYTRKDPEKTSVFGTHDMGRGTGHVADNNPTSDTYSWPDMGSGHEFSTTNAGHIIRDYNDYGSDGIEDCWALLHRDGNNNGGSGNPFLESRDCNTKMYEVCMIMPVPRKDRGCARVSSSNQHEAGNYGRQLNEADKMLLAMGGNRSALIEEWRKQLEEFERNETQRVDREYEDKTKQYKQFKTME